jgi:hypothetical protein
VSRLILDPKTPVARPAPSMRYRDDADDILFQQATELGTLGVRQRQSFRRFQEFAQRLQDVDDNVVPFNASLQMCDLHRKFRV